MLDKKQIRLLRLARQMNAAEFAKLVGTSEATIWKWEKGTRNPRYEHLVTLSGLWDDAVNRGLLRAIQAVSA